MIDASEFIDLTGTIGTNLTALLGTGETVEIPYGVVSLTTTTTLSNRSRLLLAPSARLRWDGAHGGTMFRSDTQGPLAMAHVEGGRIIPNNAGVVFDLKSPQFCSLRSLRVLAGLDTMTVVQIRTDVPAGSEPPFNSTAHMNRIEGLWVEKCGTVLDLQGGQGSSITNSTFADIDVRKLMGVGYMLREWTDNINFSGLHRLSLQSGQSVAAYLGQGVSHDVYSIGFDHLAIDTFGTLPGRRGLVLGVCKDVVVRRLHNNPLIESGAPFEDESALSYDITLSRGLVDATSVERYTKGLQ